MMAEKLFRTRVEPIAAYEYQITDVELIANFVMAHCPNINSRSAYFRSALNFVQWRRRIRPEAVSNAQPAEIALWVQNLSTHYSVASVRLKLAALRAFFDWMVVNQMMPNNPARSVRGPQERLSKGKTPALTANEARAFLNAIPNDTSIGLRDKALVAVMLYTFARIGAAIAIRREDVFGQGRRTWIRLHEKGGKVADLPCHHELDDILTKYLDSHPFADNDYIFQSIGRDGAFTGSKLQSANFYHRIKRYSKVLGFSAKLTNHSFRATGITAFLSNNGTLEMAAKIANHSSTRTTQLYDRRSDTVIASEVERIRFE